jgi:5-methylcytosine-specific restriction protein B
MPSETMVSSAQEEAEALFPLPGWGVHVAAVPYTAANHQTIWRYELDSSVRSHLQNASKSEADYTAWLGDMHFTTVAMYRTSIFGEKYLENQGWRVLVLSLPALQVGVLGLASHYQNAQRHARLAEASRLFFDHAQAVLKPHDLALPGRKVQAADWDDAGLMPNAPTSICNVPFTADQHMRLKYVRGTTVKKIIASFISVQPFAIDALSTFGETWLASLRTAAQALG